MAVFLVLGRGCGRFLGDRTKGFGCVQSRGTQAGGGTLSHDINDDRRSGRTSRLSDQAVPGTPADEGSPSCRAYEESHHPHGNQTEGDRTGIGRHAAEASRPAARYERGRRGPFWVKTYREGGMAALPPGNRNAARRTAGRRRGRSVATPLAMTVTWRRCTAGSGNWSWGTRWCGRCSR